MKKILLGLFMMVGCVVNAAGYHEFFKTGRFWGVVRTEPLKSTRAFKLALPNLQQYSIALSQLASLKTENLPDGAIDFMVKFAILDYLVPGFGAEYKKWLANPVDQNEKYLDSVHSFSLDVDIVVKGITIKQIGGGVTTLLNAVLKAISYENDVKKHQSSELFFKLFQDKVIQGKNSTSEYVLPNADANQAVYCILLDYFVNGFYLMEDALKANELNNTFDRTKIGLQRTNLTKEEIQQRLIALGLTGRDAQELLTRQQHLPKYAAPQKAAQGPNSSQETKSNVAKLRQVFEGQNMPSMSNSTPNGTFPYRLAGPAGGNSGRGS